MSHVIEVTVISPKPPFSTVRVSYKVLNLNSIFFTTDYSDSEQELPLSLVIVKKKKNISESQNHYSSKGARAVSTFRPTSCTKQV